LNTIYAVEGDCLIWYDSPIVFKLTANDMQGYGVCVDISATENSCKFHYLGIFPSPEASKNFLSGGIDWRDLHLDPNTQVFDFTCDSWEKTGQDGQ